MRRVIIAIAGLLLACVAASAEIPHVMGYQGRITENTGVPVANGTYSMQFKIYDAETGGTLLWDSDSLTVDLNSGVFSVLLGASPQPVLDLTFDQDYWLLVTFRGEDQLPRKRLGSVGYAYMASGLVAGTEVSGSVTSGTLAAVKGVNTATTGTVCGLLGESASPDGRGVQGYASATTGMSCGVLGRSISGAGWGVCGYASATAGNAWGVYGVGTSAAGRGVYGYAPATTGTTCGVRGRSDSPSGTGVNGEATASTGTTYGVYGLCNSPSGTGVWGYATATTGYAWGVRGESDSTAGRGVYGHASAATGVTYGGSFRSTSTSGRGVYGHASATAGATIGVCGESSSTDGMGVYGCVLTTVGGTRGVYGESASTDGIGINGYAWASTGTTYGLWGESASPDGRGVYGCAWAATGTTYGVYGLALSGTGYGLYSSGDFAATGSKSCVVKTSRGPTLLYCQESPECWFEDFGEGRLVKGRAHIELDSLFLETVTVDAANPMQVFLQPYHSSCAGLVVERGATGFDVYNPLEPSASGDFGYRVVAKRKGFEQKRLDYCKAGETDPYLYPHLREKELQGRRKERTWMEQDPSRVAEEHRRAERERADLR